MNEFKRLLSIKSGILKKKSWSLPFMHLVSYKKVQLNNFKSIPNNLLIHILN